MVVNDITKFCKCMSLLAGGSLNHKSSSGAQPGIGHFLKDFRKLLAVFRHLTMSGLALNGARAIEIGRLK